MIKFCDGEFHEKPQITNFKTKTMNIKNKGNTKFHLNDPISSVHFL